jgi:cellulose synthase/poly-beta-1,6-N-acetylglucosamine synthase-like glycosyltransferase
MSGNALVIIHQLDLGSFFSMFWHSVLFEMPRFLLAAFAVVSAELMRGARAPGRRGATVSVLMPGHNEGASLRAAVIGLREQTQKGMQIVVVDDGSTDNMADVGNALRREGLIDVFVYRGIRSGKSAAANLGLTYCTGDIVVIADIDTTFDRDGIARIVEPFSDPEIGGVAGNIAVRNADATMMTRFQAIQYLVSISLGRRVSDLFGIVFIASGAFAAFRREALLSVGGWEVGPGEDADITIKLRRAGWKVRFQPSAWALTDVPENFDALFKQRMRWNRSLVRVRARKFNAMFDPREPNFSCINALGTLDIIYFQALLPGSFYVYILWVFANYGAFAWVILSIVTTVYMLASLLSFTLAVAVSGHRGRWSLLPYVPGYTLFNAYVMRAIEVGAYIDELMFRHSYKDSYVPVRVQSQAERF